MVRTIAAVLVAILLASSGASALDPARSIKQLRHTAWTIQDGLPGNILAVAQTPDGYLWLGAISGLYRFDGVHAEAIQSPGPVYGLAVTDTGQLWVGSRGIWRLSHGVLTHADVPGLSNAEIRIIATGRAGQVWIANTDGQVAGFDGHTWRLVPTDWGASGRNFTLPGGVWGLAVARDGVVWAKNTFALYYLRPDSARFVQASGYGGGLVNFAKARDGRLWTADLVSRRFYALPDLARGAPQLPNFGAAVPPGVLGVLFFDRDGELWCANPVTTGLFHIRSVATGNDAPEKFTARDGLSGDLPGALIEDREGDLWVGSEGGLDRFAPANVVTDSALPVSPSRIAASDSALYVATGWTVVPPKRPQTQVYKIVRGSAPQALPFDFGGIDTFSVTPAGGLLVGHGVKLTRVNGNAVTTVALPTEADGKNLQSAADNGEEFWVSLIGKGVFRKRGGLWNKVRLPNTQDNTAPWIRADRNGVFWLFYPNGSVHRAAGDRIDAYGSSNGPNLGSVSSFTPNNDGFFLGGQFGISWFDGHRFRTLSSHRFPFLAWTLGIVSDETGSTWFATRQGIVRLSTRNLFQALREPRYALDYQFFDTRDGLAASLPTDQFGGVAARAPDGRLVFLSFHSLLLIDPRHVYRNRIPPPVVIRSLTAGQRVYDAGSGIKLSPGTANLQIDYTALSLQNPDRVVFRYRLEGVDKTWIDAGGRRQAFYTRLGPRHYRFQVIAANNDGVWNTSGAVLAFVIPPTFVQSDWFLLLCAMAVALVVWALYTFRMRQLEAGIQSRLEERVAERERIARELHDTLLQGVQGLILRFQAIMEGLPAGQPAKAQLNAALERADEVLISGRDRVRHLRAPGNDDIGEALASVVKLAGPVSHAEVRIDREGNQREVHPIVAEETTAIGREAINNALQHARATRIDVLVAYDRRGLTLSVSDNGEGIDARTLVNGGREGHFGLIGMRERARKIRGKLTFATGQSGGTVVSLNVPARAAFAEPVRERGLFRRLRRQFAEIG